MNIKSTYKNSTNIDFTLKTAIIYSLDHLFAYLVEIREGEKSYYISEKNEPVKFGNLEEARVAAIKENVKVAYLALSKTSEETDLSTCHANHQERYDYTPIKL